jgi:hypothetical protein
MEWQWLLELVLDQFCKDKELKTLANAHFSYAGEGCNGLKTTRLEM